MSSCEPLALHEEEQKKLHELASRASPVIGEPSPMKKSDPSCKHQELHPSPNYQYNKGAGLHLLPGERESLLVKASRMYIENPRTGEFQKVNVKKPTQEKQKGGKMFIQDRSIKETVLATRGRDLPSASERLEFFLQGILSGWAFLNLIVCYGWSATSWENGSRHFFGFYSSVALNNNRVLYCLTMTAVVLSLSRFNPVVLWSAISRRASIFSFLCSLSILIDYCMNVPKNCTQQE